MNSTNLREIDLEKEIERSLIEEGGYQKGDPNKFNRKSAFDEDTLVSFVKTTQPNAWKRYEKIYSANPEQCFVANLSKAIKSSTLLSILRHGFTDRGIKFRLCYFKPDNERNSETLKLYNQNILHCTRQLHYSLSSENSIDIVLFLNGIPVVSMELKNQFTGQDIGNAIDQYKFDRASKDTIFEFKNRVLVHFAVDLFNVAMTTKLAGPNTYFLPFNQGSNGAGNVGGKGNPDNPNGFVTSYLWEKVLCKDKLMEIIQKYLHLEKKVDKKTKAVKETMIFPRFHQLDVVTKLVADVSQNGVGKNYLIQHSAGSGKSNSIAWLSYQLSSLHNKSDEKMFNSVVVLTDRKVLDSQLQDTIYQFDHVEGVVTKVKNGSKELRDSINAGVPIIVSTLQKFPYIYKEITSKNKNFAIIVDEAHSSQSGKAASTVVEGLGDIEEALKEYAQIEGKAEAQKEDTEDTLVKTLASQGQHPNLSFFAFTATPKAKTLNRFGTKMPGGKYVAFHTYSMKQAIEEGFILDVLQNYTTYKTYYNIQKKIKEDPELEKAKGSKALARFQTLHPHNIAQKTEVMIEHFRNVTKNKIGGKAKAMVVTSSRLQALLYLEAFKKYIAEKNYDDVDVLVAFSGELIKDGESFTESSLNKTKDGNNIKENQLPDYFHDDFNVLIVAEKYQTGFDEPLLHTMFVDKKLNDVKAVQTLSRLNRTAPDKTDTFVLDFVNDRKTIKESFQQYYQATYLEKEIDPNELYKLKGILDDLQICYKNDIENFSTVYYASKQDGKELGKLSNFLRPALQRYTELSQENKEKFKTVLNNFLRMYGFIIQVTRLFDSDLQKFYVYGKFLVKFLRDNTPPVKLDDKILLSLYKLEKTEEGAIKLDDENGTAGTISGGTATTHREKEPLSRIIEKFNARFGTEFTGMDKVLSQVMDDMKQDNKLVQAGEERNKTLFKGLYNHSFENVMVSRYQENDQFFKELFKDEDKLTFMKKLLLEELYHDLGQKKKKK